MAKISPVSAKYIVHASIQIEGVVDRPDVIGAVFGQTEGLLGADLELRELQKSGRIGRIEVNTETKGGKTQGSIIIPSSLDKAETAIVGAALEVIQRIGPCNAKIKVENIEDVRVSKRQFVIERAKELLKVLMDSVMPDSQELADEVAYSVRVMEVTEYGNERLPAGPTIDESDEVIVVEGMADVLNLLKHGFKNVIALNGTSVPQTIIELSKKKIMTAFVDGDRGGSLILQELFNVAELDFVTRAPDGKEVEEITKKEIHKALRARITLEQAKMEFKSYPDKGRPNGSRDVFQQREDQRRDDRRDMRPNKGGPLVQQDRDRRPQMMPPPPSGAQSKRRPLTPKEKESFSSMLEDLIGTRGAYILDDKLNILGKVPVTELQSTIKSLNTGIYAVVFDGIVDKDLVMVAERANVVYLVGMDTKVKGAARVQILTADNVQ